MAHFIETEIGELIDRVGSWSPATDSNDAEFTYIDLSSVDKDSKSIVSPVRTPCADAPSRARQLVAFRDVLVSTVRPNLNGVAPVPAELDGATASTGFCVLRPRPEKVCWRYLYHWVRSPAFIRDMTRKATGASYPAVSDRIIHESKIPLPKLEEQKRIATILDKADSIRRKRQETIDIAGQELLKATFRNGLGSPRLNPHEWPVRKLGDVVNFIGGSQPPKETFEYEPKPGYVRLVQIRDFKTDKYPTYIPAELARRPFKKDDVMIARYGPPVFQILRGLEGSYNVALMKAEPTELATKDFIFHLLQIPEIHDVVVAHSQRTAGQSGTNLELLRKLEIPIPPVEEQDRIVLRTSCIERYVEKATRHFQDAERLFNSLVQRAFKGEL